MLSSAMRRAVPAFAALAVMLWFAGSLRSLALAEEGVGTVGSARSQADLQAGSRQLDRARRFNDDTDLLVREGAALLLRRGSGSQALGLLLSATRGRDGAAAARARRRIADLLVRGGAARLAPLGAESEALRLERRAVLREPENATAWFGLLSAARGRDGAAAALAGRRVAELDPRLAAGLRGARD